MYSRRRPLPSEVSSWMEKDVKIRKITPGSSLMPNDTRQNATLSRQFFSDMLNLSSERYRKISQREIDKRTFLEKQRVKAETSMPGLLPYVEQLTDDMNRTVSSRNTFSRSDQFTSSSLQSFSSRRSNIKSESTLYPRQQSARKSKSPPSISMKQKPSGRINHLAQPKGRRYDPTANDHVRSNNVGTLTVKDLFGRIDDMSSYNPTSSDKPKSASKDRRFRQLFQIFSDVHERQPSNIQTVRSIVESNLSLQNDQQRWQKITNTSKSHKNHQQILANQIFKKNDIFLVDISA